MTPDGRVKEEYETPKLVELGSLEDLTQGADVAGFDGQRGGPS
jgi:hypothetical protein